MSDLEIARNFFPLEFSTGKSGCFWFFGEAKQHGVGKERDETGELMKNMIETFWKDEEGAVIADYVVLTAAVTWMGLSGIQVVNQTIGGVAQALETEVQRPPVSVDTSN